MDLLGSLSGETQLTPAPVQCSRKGCKAVAAYQILWNNPKIHTPDRRKIWLACAEHREWLESYLKERLLYKETLPFDASKGAGH
ncbi:acetone carboxylase [Glutamicibacter sp.]|uniref:acetone carboxylase n=1 Tax=Glutamicibacter sp. TaxID=1931995 RepID=UPI0028BDC36D|nr:acetone carboxylase [Glutamicibacter sp.]